MSSIEKNFAFIPDLFRLFLCILFVGKDLELQIAWVGQAIVQATRPRVILAPLQLGLGVQMHHHFACKFLIDSLHAHGFCSSYPTVQKFERSAEPRSQDTYQVTSFNILQTRATIIQEL